MGRGARYLDVADRLAERWSALEPGTLVESEHQLAEEFGVNRLTAREAVRELERRMVVRRVMGAGTFTAYRLDYRISIGGAASFHRNMLAIGHEPGVVVHELAWEGRGASRRLRVERVSSVDGFVATSATDWFVRSVGERIEGRLSDAGSMHAAMLEIGLEPRRRSVQVVVETPPPDVAARLDFSAAPLPTWRVRSVTMNALDDTDVHESDTWMRTDMFALTIELADQRAALNRR